jgi:hypothetical protein
MGANVARRLVWAGRECDVYDANPRLVDKLAGMRAIPPDIA